MSDKKSLHDKIQHVVNIARNTSQSTFDTSVYVMELLEILNQELEEVNYTCARYAGLAQTAASEFNGIVVVNLADVARKLTEKVREAKDNDYGFKLMKARESIDQLSDIVRKLTEERDELIKALTLDFG